MNNFGILLNKSRKLKGMTFRELALQTGLSIGYLCGIEKGRKNPPKLSKVLKIESVLGITDNRLMDIAVETKKRCATNLAYHIKEKPNLALALAMVESDIKQDEINDVVDFLKGVK